MTPLPSPPDRLRRTATREDAAALERLCGVTFDLADLPALLDPRGLRLQRLDWTPSRGRCADLVEALVGAAWIVSPEAALQVAEVLVHPV